MSPKPARTMYETAGRRRQRRRRALWAAFAVMVAVIAAGAAVVIARGAGPGGAATSPTASSASEPGSPGSPAGAAPASRRASVSPTAAGPVRVHSGERVSLGYRITGVPVAGSKLSLEVRAATGDAVLERSLPPGKVVEGAGAATLRAALPAGAYTYVFRLAGPNVRSGAAAETAALTVLTPLRPGFPGAKATSAALGWARGRAGRVAVAVVDTNGGLSGFHEHETFQAASLAKAILLVAYLRKHPAADPSLDPVVAKMIEESDNASAYQIFGDVGAGGMGKVARLARMEDYVQGSSWLDTRVSAADEARFFYHLQAYVPSGRRALARQVLSGITPIQRWGIPAAAGAAGWKTYFKGGWLGEDNRLMLQAAWLDKGKRHWALAVMSDEDPTRSYGWDTEKGVTGLLLGRQPTASYLALVLEY